jgi:hypothetical protein
LIIKITKLFYFCSKEAFLSVCHCVESLTRRHEELWGNLGGKGRKGRKIERGKLKGEKRMSQDRREEIPKS